MWPPDGGHAALNASARAGPRCTTGEPATRRSPSRTSWSISGIPSLIAQLEGELAAREADRGPEPELAAPRPDGPLAGLQPLTISD